MEQENLKLKVSASPHVRSKATTSDIMFDVVIALVPQRHSVCTYLAGMQRYWSQSVSEAVWGLKHCIRSVWARR